MPADSLIAAQQLLLGLSSSNMEEYLRFSLGVLPPATAAQMRQLPLTCWRLRQRSSRSRWQPDVLLETQQLLVPLSLLWPCHMCLQAKRAFILQKVREVWFRFVGDGLLATFQISGALRMAALGIGNQDSFRHRPGLECHYLFVHMFGHLSILFVIPRPHESCTYCLCQKQWNLEMWICLCLNAWTLKMGWSSRWSSKYKHSWSIDVFIQEWWGMVWGSLSLSIAAC